MFGYKRLDDVFTTIRNAEYTPADRLAKRFGVTSRTIRTDISKINGILEEHGAHIAMKREAGYYLIIDDEASFGDFLERAGDFAGNAPDLSSANERIRFLLRNLLLANGFIKVDELAGMVFVGGNTLQNYLRQLREILARYELALIPRAGAGVKVLGREVDRRRCFMENVIVRNMRDYVTGFNKAEEALFPNIDLKLLEEIVRSHLATSDIISNDYGFKNLLVHIALMIARVKSGCEVEAIEDIEVMPRIEYFIDDTCADLEVSFGVVLPRSERRYLFMHLLSNTTLNEPDINTHLIQNDIDEMLELVYRNYGFDLRDDAELKNNLTIHLITTFRSKNLKLNKKNPLLNTIRTNFPLAFEIALASTLKVFDTEPHTLNEDEVGYVALHIGAAMERVSPKDQEHLKIILVCGSGKSITEMLRSRIETFFGDKLDIVSTISYRRFSTLEPAQLADIDFVVTTVPLEDCPLPNVLVDFSLSSQDTEAISRLLNNMRKNQASKIAKFFDPELCVHVSSPTPKGALLQMLCDRLETAGVVDENFIASVIEREGLSDTNMGPTFAIPHSMKPISNKTKVAIATLDHPVAWNEGTRDVRIVFLLAVRAGDRENIEHLYDLLLEIANNRHMQQSILDATDFDSVMDALLGAEII